MAAFVFLRVMRFLIALLRAIKNRRTLFQSLCKIKGGGWLNGFRFQKSGLERFQPVF